jgi:hypothetical protein
VFNKGTGNITVKIEMFSTSEHNFFCGPALVLFPKSGTWCFGQDNGFGNVAYCKITTTSLPNTRASIMVLGAGFQAVSAAEAK